MVAAAVIAGAALAAEGTGLADVSSLTGGSSSDNNAAPVVHKVTDTVKKLPAPPVNVPIETPPVAVPKPPVSVPSVPLPKVPAPSVPTDPKAAVAQLLAMVNQERTQAGCLPLKEVPKLDAAAQKFADLVPDNPAKDVLSHLGPDGSTLLSRVGVEGYLSIRLGETLAHGQQTATAAFTSWMDDSQSKTTLTDCGFTDVGLGFHPDQVDPRWVLDLGAEK
ncbi:MAG: CAP domain-containing protein [Mycobacteriales bacterium]